MTGHNKEEDDDNNGGGAGKSKGIKLSLREGWSSCCFAPNEQAGERKVQDAAKTLILSNRNVVQQLIFDHFKIAVPFHC